MKKYTNNLILILLFFFIFQILTNSSSIIDVIIFSMEIWKKSIFSTLFPFFIISDLLISYGFIELVSKFFSPIMRLFKIKTECAFIFILSIFSGFPSNSKYAKELYEKGIIDEYDATKVLTFTHFSNPLFILGNLSIFLDKKIALIVLFSHYFGNFIIGLLYRNYHPSYNNNIFFERDRKQNSFIDTLTNSIIKTIDTLLLLLGIITCFLVLTTILDKTLEVPNVIQYILNGIIEMTQGIKYMSMISINSNIKAIISTFFLSFGGICIHVQVKSILKGTNIKYLPYLIARILHGIISSMITMFLINI